MIMSLSRVLHYCDSCNDDTMGTTDLYIDKTVVECEICQHRTSYWIPVECQK